MQMTCCTRLLPLSVILLATAAPAQSAEANRPNILFILADDLGWGDLSCYGNTRFKTPALDRLASEGTLFTQYYQGGSVCSPSRCTLMTGRWPAEFRIHGHYAGPEENRSRVELYNIPADPSEQNNVAAQHAGIVERLIARALDWQKTLPPGTVEPAAGKNDYPWPNPARR